MKLSKVFHYSASVLALTCVVTLGGGCSANTSDPENAGGGDTPSDESHVASKSEALTVGNIAGCTIYASISQGTRNGFGEVSCSNYENSLQVETCLQQLVTGGWQTIDWTCQTWDGGAHHYVYTTSTQVPYWTNGRWYRTLVFGTVNGQRGSLLSEGMQG